MAIEERRFAKREGAARALAEDLAFTLRKAVSARGRALLAVSGGRTPRCVFSCLRELDVDWARVTITLTDERWVPPDHPDSNEGLVRSHLLKGRAAAAEFISLYGGERSPRAGQSACEARLAALKLPFDAVYLGTAGDGHFASLFPGDPVLDARNRICVAVSGKGSRKPRMTLTAQTILDANKLFLLFWGAEKNAIFAEAKKPGSYRDLPLRLVLLQDRTAVGVFSAP